MRILVTCAVGFIGMHVTHRLLNDGHEVAGLDNLNDYYDIELKHSRLDYLEAHRFTFHKLDLAEIDGLNTLFAEFHKRLLLI